MKRPLDWTFASLSEGRVCSSSSLCCEVTDIDAESLAGWAVGVLDGIDGDDYTGLLWAAQGCMVLPCTQPGVRCLTYQQPPAGAPIHGITLTLGGLPVPPAGDVSGPMLLPEAFGRSQSQEQVMLSPAANNTTAHAGEYTFTTRVEDASLTATLSLSLANQHWLSSALIYRRDFQADDLPYAC